MPGGWIKARLTPSVWLSYRVFYIDGSNFVGDLSPLFMDLTWLLMLRHAPFERASALFWIWQRRTVGDLADRNHEA